jgi:hypothetical protein
MSNYHVLNMNRKKTTATVAYHIPIPDEDNNAQPTPHKLRDVIIEQLTQGNASITTQVPNLETEFATEWADIQSGAIYEYVETKGVNGNFNDSERFDKWNDRYDDLATRELRRWRKKLRLWGSNKDAP